jgi:precorrin-8X/cobalt-precorrin-8 methylmutase
VPNLFLTIPNQLTVSLDYIRDGQAIYQKSFTIIRAEADLANIPADLEKVVVRSIHASGMTDLPSDFAASPQAGSIGRQALIQGATILCDSKMVANGITTSRLPAHNQIICTLNEPQVPEIAQRISNTRSAAAIELWQPHLAGSIAVIGNAPTALFYLLELLDRSAPKPALIIGMPVGFVGAAESKRELALHPRGVPFITLHGRRGGSAIATAVINALAREEE